jgi:TIR domain
MYKKELSSMPSVAIESVTNKVKIFISYSHVDERFKDRLVVSLSQLKREELIEIWTDRDIMLGELWDKKIKVKLEEANLILLLISPDFIASEYCYDFEMRQAMDRSETGKARVIPILLRPSDWKTSPFASLQGLPRDLRPVTKWDDEDSAFLNIIEGIRSICTVV